MAQNISKNLSFVGENIKKIRQAKKLSQADFASLFHLARPSVGAYEEGRSEPKIDTLIQIANYFRISVDLLLTRKLTISEIYSFDQLNKTLDKVHQKKGKSQSGSHTVQLVKSDQQLEYIVNHQKRDYLGQLAEFSLPGKASEPTRLFENSGIEMQYNEQGIHPKDILLTQRITIDQLSEHVDSIIVLVSQQGVLIRRLKEYANDMITLTADNPSVDDQSLKATDVLESWQAIGLYTSQLQAPTRLEERVLKIEKLIDQLGDKLDR